MKILPMNKDFLLFKCIHCGPLDSSNIETKNRSGETVSKEQFERNRKFLARLIDTYGSCAMLAIEGNSVVAHVRFYPKIILDRFEFCCHVSDYAITSEMVEMDLPEIKTPADRNLKINCFLVDKAYRGQGLSGDLITAIVEWAGSNGWNTVSALAAHDNYWLSLQMCIPKLNTYQKLGFEMKKKVVIPEAKEHLKNIREGKLGADKQKEFELHCGGKDADELSSLYEVERGVAPRGLV
ncbi:GNAT family N-acetyltransferase [Candidatus Latescibacterota bacterium]